MADPIASTSSASASASASPRHLMSLGMFVFGMDTANYSEMQRDIDWRWGKSERLGARPARQYLGQGDDNITLSGSIIPGVSGTYSSIDRLIEMADSARDGGGAWPFIDGNGKVIGQFSITKLVTTLSNIMAGGLARWTDFTITLERAD